MGNTAEAPVQLVEGAVTILETLARSGEAGVTEMAGETGVHKSTALRVVSTLEKSARPICRKLSADTGETANIAVLSEWSAFTSISSPAPRRFNPYVSNCQFGGKRA